MDTDIKEYNHLTNFRTKSTTNSLNCQLLTLNLALIHEHFRYFFSCYLTILKENELPFHYLISLLMIDNKSLQIYNMNY